MSRPTKSEVAEQNRFLLREQSRFRSAADAVARVLSDLVEVQRIALFGSCARPLAMEVPRFSSYRRYGIEVLHECKDVDLAVWVDHTDRLKEFQRARSKALAALLAARDIGVAHHQVDMFLLSAADGRYLGRLCWYGTCPKDGKMECRVDGCGASPFLKQHEDFEFHANATAPDRSVKLYERGRGIIAKAADLPPQDVPS